MESKAFISLDCSSSTNLPLQKLNPKVHDPIVEAVHKTLTQV